MSWGKIAYETIFASYDGYFDKVAKSRSQNHLIAKDILIRTAIMKHDITKRQLKIISFILTMSFQSGKDYAIIPKLQDFELCGVSKTKIKNEINLMEQMGIIIWDKEMNTFSIDNPNNWKCSNNAGYNATRFTEVANLNLKHLNYDTDPILEKMKEKGY